MSWKSIKCCEIDNILSKNSWYFLDYSVIYIVKLKLQGKSIISLENWIFHFREEIEGFYSISME